MSKPVPAPGADGAGAFLSIGALSAATGVPVETIRSWERRYGYPRAERKPSGHRVYPLETVGRLRRIAQALARGHRAAEVLPASEVVLDALMAALPPGAIRAASEPAGPRAFSAPASLFEAVRAYDRAALDRAFEAAWVRHGPLAFLDGWAAPWLSAIGAAWADGTLEIRHEHFASACLGDFLRAVRAPLERQAEGHIGALATLTGELHGLGLQMAAVVFAQAGWRPLIVGVDTPVEQLAALIREAPITAVAVSCADRAGARHGSQLRRLREQIPRRIPVLAGGAGAPSVARTAGIERFADLASLDRWLRQRHSG